MNSITPGSFVTKNGISILVMTFVTIFLSACEVAEKSDSSDSEEIAVLNISGDKALVLDAEQNLSQIGPKFNSAGAMSSAVTLEAVNDVLGNAVAAEFVLPVNDRYVFVKNIGKKGHRGSDRHAILDLKSGKHVRLNSWPENPARIASSATTAYYVSNHCIVAVDLAKGKTETVSCRTKQWHPDQFGYSDNIETGWTARTWLYVDPSSNLFAIDYYSLSNGTYAQGIAGKFSNQNGQWIEDVQFHNAFPSMPYGLSNQIPGSLLVNSTWLIADAKSAGLYLVEFSGSSMSLRPYDLNSWSAGSPIATFNLTHPMTNTTFLGLNNYIQDSLITDGQSIIRIKSNLGVLSIEEIAVPSSIPVETASGVRKQGYVQYWSRGTVTNWNYLQDNLYFFNSVNGLTYSWDLNPFHSPEMIENSEKITFVY